jgi:DNA-binding transcriptional regulator YhcF (GntR family)
MISKSRKVKINFIIECAIKYAINHGFHSLTIKKLARAIKMPESSIRTYFKVFKNFKKQVMLTAIRRKAYLVIAQGLAMRDSEALKISRALKKRAVKTLLD